MYICAVFGCGGVDGKKVGSGVTEECDLARPVPLLLTRSLQLSSLSKLAFPAPISNFVIPLDFPIHSTLSSS